MPQREAFERILDPFKIAQVLKTQAEPAPDSLFRGIETDQVVGRFKTWVLLLTEPLIYRETRLFIIPETNEVEIHQERDLFLIFPDFEPSSPQLHQIDHDAHVGIRGVTNVKYTELFGLKSKVEFVRETPEYIASLNINESGSFGSNFDLKDGFGSGYYRDIDLKFKDFPPKI